MACNGEACVPDEASDHFGPSRLAAELAMVQPLQVNDGSGQRFLHDSLNERVALLPGLEIGCIRRQMSHRIILRVCRDEGSVTYERWTWSRSRTANSGVPTCRRK
jgi:hypothetical protein